MQRTAHTREGDALRFPQPGDEFAEQYVIRSLVGRGGSSRVYSATQSKLDRDVAIKVLAPTAANAGRPELVERRFYREARLASQLRGPHTVMLHDYGRTPEGLLFMVSELVEGQDLRRLIEQTGALGVERTRRIFVQIIRGLYEAHSRGFLHRDVKPSNVMVFDQLGQRDVVKLLDFGLAKGLGAEDSDVVELTMAGTVLGTPGYMSPEQALGRPVTASSDLFSAALVAYEMLVGQSPFRGLSFPQMRQRLLHEPPRLPPTVDVDDDLARVLERALRIAPEERYQSAAEILVELGDAPDGATIDPGSESPHRGELNAFPMMFDATGVTTIDTLTDSGTGEPQTLELPDTTQLDVPPSKLVGSESEPYVNAAPDEPERRKLTPGIIGAIAMVVLVVLVMWRMAGDRQSVTQQPDARAVERTAASPTLPFPNVASESVERARRHGALEAEIQAKGALLQRKAQTVETTPRNAEKAEPPRSERGTKRRTNDSKSKLRDFDVKAVDEL